jgi:hypothetical protein
VITLTEQESRWVAGLANRLRLVQADTASATPTQRREYLKEELTRHLKDTAPGNRRRYVEALLARFPVGQTVRAAAPAPPPPAETFELLLDRFLKAAQEQPGPKRTEVANRLAGAGLAKPDPGTTALELINDLRQGLGLATDDQPPGTEVLRMVDELRQGLGLAADQPIRLERLVQLVALLVGVFQRLDQMALEALRETAPKSPLLKRPQDFRSAAAQFLTHEESALEPQARMVVDLLAAVLKAFADGGRDFGAKYVQRMSPAAIRDVVLAEGRKGVLPIFGKSTDELCWEKYLQLAKDYETADKVNQRIRECLAAFIEQKVLRGR